MRISVVIISQGYKAIESVLKCKPRAYADFSDVDVLNLTNVLASLDAVSYSKGTFNQFFKIWPLLVLFFPLLILLLNIINSLTY